MRKLLVHGCAFVSTVSILVALTVAATPAAAKDWNCTDFKNHRQAQKFFKKHHGSKHNDPYGLDSDHDGIACES